jgi:hypothetical protein
MDLGRGKAVAVHAKQEYFADHSSLLPRMRIARITVSFCEGSDAPIAGLLLADSMGE